MNLIKSFALIFFLISFTGCTEVKSSGNSDTPPGENSQIAEEQSCGECENPCESNEMHLDSAKIDHREKSYITFVELGSVNCIPCKQMQPVMKAIEKKYGNQIKVVFYDVWKQEQKHYAQKYGIKLIPTQVFLDENGKEFFRHEGFYPESEIDKLLNSKGLKPKG